MAVADQLALFGASVSPNSTYGYAGALFPIKTSLGEPGFLLRLWASGIQFDYDAGTPVGEVRARGPEFETALGHLWVFGNTSLAFYGSLKYRSIRLNPDDPSSDTARQHFGLGVQAELTQRFTPAWGYSLIAGYTALVKNYWTRLRPYRNVGQLSLGPELIFSGGDEYVDNRCGAFLDGIPLGPLRLGISGGVERERGKGNDPYGALSLSFLF